MKSKKSRMRMSMRPRLGIRTKQVTVATSAAAVVIGVLLTVFNLTQTREALAGTLESIPSGSFIVNMGITPQTISNGLKPYGMIYDLIVNYGVPVKWIIETGKSKDGTDFSYNGVNYKGGPFIISADYINSTIASRITYWQSQGVQGVYTTASISAPVYANLTNFPRVLIDTISKNESIIAGYFTNAMIPSSSYEKGSPSLLTTCHDVWVNPHGDPAWSTHAALYNFVTVTKSYIWSECHAVSVMESVTDPVAPFEQLNYLSTKGLKCYSSGKCGTIAENHAGNSSSPYTYYYPGDPVMQFMGTMDGASGAGSEKWYVPLSTGSWRPTTRRLVTTSDGASPNEGVLMVYGPGFGDAANGWVMYEAGHDIDGSGSTAEKVAAQRAFFNFLLLAGKAKQLLFSSYTIPATIQSLQNYTVAVSVSAGSPGYTYAWSSTVGGTFDSQTSATTTFRAPNVPSSVSGVIKCTVTDACGRINFISVPVSLSSLSPLPITLLRFSAEKKDKLVEINWATASEINNDFFTIERSRDGTTFTSIAQIKGAGNSSRELHYSYIDDAPLNGESYYRLKQTDYDGKSETFEPVHVNMLDDAKSDMKVYPQPFEDFLKIDFSSKEQGQILFLLYNSNGQVVKTCNMPGEEGISTCKIETPDLPRGTYVLKMTKGGSVISSTKVIRI